MPRGVPYDYLNLTDPNADVLAADASVLAHGVCVDGGIALMGGMFGLVRKDLDRGCRETRAWLDSDDFTACCDACRVDPAALRDHLISAHWRHRAA
jgi:hypothetical protein